MSPGFVHLFAVDGKLRNKARGCDSSRTVAGTTFIRLFDALSCLRRNAPQLPVALNRREQGLRSKENVRHAGGQYLTLVNF